MKSSVKNSGAEAEAKLVKPYKLHVEDYITAKPTKEDYLRCATKIIDMVNDQINKYNLLWYPPMESQDIYLGVVTLGVTDVSSAEDVQTWKKIVLFALRTNMQDDALNEVIYKVAKERLNLGDNLTLVRKVGDKNFATGIATVKNKPQTSDFHITFVKGKPSEYPEVVDANDDGIVEKKEAK